MMKKPYCKVGVCLVIVASFLSNSVSAQDSLLPKASRTIYKCTVNGKVGYSDDPCIGAQALRIEPTRGLNKSTGRELTGNDVRRERFNEQISDAIKPLTGLNREQFAVQSGRQNLMPKVKEECRRLDFDISTLEVQERQASSDKPAVQRSLFNARKQYRDLHC